MATIEQKQTFHRSSTRGVNSYFCRARALFADASNIVRHRAGIKLVARRRVIISAASADRLSHRRQLTIIGVPL